MLTTSTTSTVTNSSKDSLLGLDTLKSTGLDKTAFLKLLVTELTYQNPMEPVDNKDFIAQLAQFSSLEEMENMAQEFSQIAQSSKWSYGVSLIGRQVLAAADKGDVKGKVISVGIEDDQIMLQLDSGDKISPSVIKEVW